MDLYAILEVPNTATDEVIKLAYRRLAMKWHPDRNNGDPAATEKFKDIERAYATLSDPALRRQYDETGAIPGMGPSKEDQLHADAVRVFNDALTRAFDPLTTNLVDLMQQLVREKQQEVVKARAKLEKTMARLEKIAGKFSRADGKPNRIGDYINAELANGRQQIVALDQMFDTLGELETYIGSYSFDPDAPATAESMFGFIMNGGADAPGFTITRG